MQGGMYHNEFWDVKISNPGRRLAVDEEPRLKNPKTAYAPSRDVVKRLTNEIYRYVPARYHLAGKNPELVFVSRLCPFASPY